MHPSLVLWPHLALGILNRAKTIPASTATREAHSQARLHANIDYVSDSNRERTEFSLLYHPLTRHQSRHILFMHSHNDNLQAPCLSPQTGDCSHVMILCVQLGTHRFSTRNSLTFETKTATLTHQRYFDLTLRHQKGSQRQELDTGSALVHNQRNLRLHGENGNGRMRRRRASIMIPCGIGQCHLTH